MAAALELQSRGLSCAIVEREDHLGGILTQCIHNGFGLIEFNEELAGPEFAERFEEKVRKTDITPFCGATVIEMEVEGEDKLLSCASAQGVIRIRARAVILAMRDKPTSKVVLVTDALKPTEQEGHCLFANREEVELRDGVFMRKKDDVIAGSSLTMIRGLENLASWGVPIENAIEMAASNPARIIGLGKRGLLVPGYEADLVVFDKEFKVRACLVGGRFVKNEF